MTNAATSPVNEQMRAKLIESLDRLLAQALRRGFFGTAELTVSVQDGTIQHLRSRVERIEKT